MKILSAFIFIVILVTAVLVITRGVNNGADTEPLDITTADSSYRSTQRSAVPEARSAVHARTAEVAKVTSPRFHPANIRLRLAQMGTVPQERAKIILSPAEVLALAGEPNGREGEDQTVSESLSKDIWDGHAHLLVQALEQGKGIELTHGQVMEFLSGEQDDWSDSS